MDEMIATLKKIGMPDEICQSIRDNYDGDLDKLTCYVLYCIAAYDDRHEYVG